MPHFSLNKPLYVCMGVYGQMQGCVCVCPKVEGLAEQRLTMTVMSGFICMRVCLQPSVDPDRSANEFLSACFCF